MPASHCVMVNITCNWFGGRHADFESGHLCCPRWKDELAFNIFQPSSSRTAERLGNWVGEKGRIWVSKCKPAKIQESLRTKINDSKLTKVVLQEMRRPWWQCTGQGTDSWWFRVWNASFYIIYFRAGFNVETSPNCLVSAAVRCLWNRIKWPVCWSSSTVAP